MSCQPAVARYSVASYSSTFVKEKQRIGQGSRPSSLRSITKNRLTT